MNRYIDAATTDPRLLPADYAAAAPQALPQKWSVADVVAIAGLIGGIFGKGGGIEVQNAHLLEYLRKELGTADGSAAFQQFRTSNDPLAPTTADKAFPYENHGKVDPATTALPDYGVDITGGPTATDPNCDLTQPNPMALSILKGLAAMPKHMSNALVVNANHSQDGHPVAVFGPQVSYYAPQILSQLDLHSPDYAAEGASFPGTGIVELGRGTDYAWSATSAGSDLVDQRLEKICNPGGGSPDPHGTYYTYKGKCVAMTTENFDETAFPKPGGVGAPAQLNHVVHLTRHGIVQGWTTAGGQPVAVVVQRSTFNHDVDSVVGFLGWGQPAVTHDVKSWMASAAKISFTFNWLYVDNRDTGYFVSGLDPIRPSNVDPSLPTWGTGISEWQGYLPVAQHVHEVNPPTGYFVSWNNKPAPGFARRRRPVRLRADLPLDHADDAARQPARRARRQGDPGRRSSRRWRRRRRRISTAWRSSRCCCGSCPGATSPPASPPCSMQLHTWVADGAHRRKAASGDTQYAHAAAVAIADELIPNLIQALYDPILKDGGLGAAGSPGGAMTAAYTQLPMQFVNTPNSGGAHLGSAYDGGYEGYLVASLQQLLGQHPADGFGTAITKHECGGGPSTCGSSIDAALTKTYNDLVTANGSSTVSAWNASTDSKAAKQTMPVYDAIHLRALGIVGQPDLDWQNRPDVPAGDRVLPAPGPHGCRCHLGARSRRRRTGRWTRYRPACPRAARTTAPHPARSAWCCWACS